MSGDSEFERFSLEDQYDHGGKSTGGGFGGGRPERTKKKERTFFGCCMSGCLFGCGGVIIVLLLFGGLGYWFVSSLFSTDPLVVRQHFAGALEIQLPPGFEPRRSFVLPNGIENTVSALATSVPLEDFDGGIENNVAIAVARLQMVDEDAKGELFMIMLALELGIDAPPGSIEVIQVGNNKFKAIKSSWTRKNTNLVRYIIRVQDNAYLIVAGPSNKVTRQMLVGLLKSVKNPEPDLQPAKLP